METTSEQDTNKEMDAIPRYWTLVDNSRPIHVHSSFRKPEQTEHLTPWTKHDSNEQKTAVLRRKVPSLAYHYPIPEANEVKLENKLYTKLNTLQTIYFVVI